MSQRRTARDHVFRYLIISVIFCLICVIYLGRLFYIQISGRQNRYDTDTTVRIVTVPAVRGEIYDRNGKKLVANEYSYDLVIYYASFSKLDERKSNQACLQLSEALRACGEQAAHEEKYFPFEGTYPNYWLPSEAIEQGTVPYYRMLRIINELEIDASEYNIGPIFDYYTETYQLLETDADGNRLYTDEQIDRIIRLRYDMDAKQFQAGQKDYTFASDLSASSPLIPYVAELGLTGVTFTVDASRTYLYPGYASHILGGVGPIYAEEWQYYNALGYQMNAIVGKSGCELAFESYLRGMDGRMEIEVDATGKIIRETMLEEPVAGKDVYLTIDIELQIAAEDGLAENVQTVVDQSNGSPSRGSGCNAGAAVAMDPDTFDILVIASYPTYNLATYNQDYNNLAANPALPLYNRALLGAYEPGSTYKLGMAIAALMEEEITSESLISCQGAYPPTHKNPIDCSTYGAGSHVGNTNLITAIAESCNSFFCELGDRLGIARMERYMSQFGFGEATGIELGGTSGVLAGPAYRQQIGSSELWDGGLETGFDTWMSAIGQSHNLASPLQLACYVGTLANGGTRYSAHLLHSVYEFGNPEPVYVYTQTEETVQSRLDIPADVQSTVFTGMREVVTSSSRINNYMKKLPVSVGGKTGTAQNSTNCDNALFVAAAPYNAPEIVISVVLEQGYAGSLASQTAATILDAYYNGTPDAE